MSRAQLCVAPVVYARASYLPVEVCESRADGWLLCASTGHAACVRGFRNGALVGGPLRCGPHRLALVFVSPLLRMYPVHYDTRVVWK